jgi:hypothetical protein
MRVIVQKDGIYYDDGAGHEVLLEGASRVNANGSVTVRFPARDVVVREAFEPQHAIDMSDILRWGGARPPARGGLTYAQLSSVRPGVATFLQNQGVVEGSVE